MAARSRTEIAKDPGTDLVSARRNLALWFVLCIVVGGLGLYLSYGPLTSKPWLWKFGLFEGRSGWENLGGQKEFFRLIVISLLGLLGHIRIFRGASLRYWEGKPHPLAFYRSLWRRSGCATRRLVLVAVLAILIYHVVVGPIQLNEAYSSIDPGVKWNVRDYQVPYLCYMLYSYVQYCLVGMPMLIVMLGGLRADRRDIDKLTEGLPEARLQYVTSDHVEHLLERTRATFLDVKDRLVALVDRYFFAFAIIVLYVAFETRFTIQTLACWAEDALLWSAWIFVVFVVPGFVYMAFRAHNRVASMRRETLECARKEIWDKPSLSNALGMVNDQREQAAKEGSPLAFLWSLRKSSIAGVLVLLLVFGLAQRIFEPTLKDLETAADAVLPRPLPGLVAYASGVLDAGDASKAQSRPVNLTTGCQRDRPTVQEWQAWLESRP